MNVFTRLSPPGWSAPLNNNTLPSAGHSTKLRKVQCIVLMSQQQVDQHSQLSLENCGSIVWTSNSWGHLGKVTSHTWACFSHWEVKKEIEVIPLKSISVDISCMLSRKLPWRNRAAPLNSSPPRVCMAWQVDGSLTSF